MVFQYQSSQSIIDTIVKLKLLHINTQYLFWWMSFCDPQTEPCIDFVVRLKFKVNDKEGPEKQDFTIEQSPYNLSLPILLVNTMRWVLSLGTLGKRLLKQRFDRFCQNIFQLTIKMQQNV